MGGLATWLAMAAAGLATLGCLGWPFLRGSRLRVRAFGGGATLACLGVGAALYGLLGSPGLPDAPLGGRKGEIAGIISASEETLRQAASDLEAARLGAADKPGDIEAQFALAEAAARAGDGATEIAALESILAMTGSPAVKAMIGEAVSREAGGIVTSKALEWIEEALAEDPADWRARYLKGLHLSQAGDDRAALGYWVPLAGEAVGSRIYPALAEAVELAAGRLGLDASELLPVAGGMDILAMVDGLESRLLGEGRVTDHDGWAMLIRSRIVLGDEAALHQRLDDLLERLQGPSGDPGPDRRLLVAAVEMLLPPDNLPEAVPPVVGRLLERARELDPGDSSVLFFSGLAARIDGNGEQTGEWWGRLYDRLEEDDPLRALIGEELGRLAP